MNINEFYIRIRKFCFLQIPQKTRNRYEIAEEITQNTFLSLQKSGKLSGDPKYDEYELLINYAIIVAKHIYIDYIRRSHSKLRDKQLTNWHSNNPNSNTHDRDFFANIVDNNTEEKNNKSKYDDISIFSLMKGISKRDREVLYQKFWKKRGHRTTAKKLGIGHQSVRNIIQRSKKKIRDNYTKLCECTN